MYSAIYLISEIIDALLLILFDSHTASTAAGNYDIPVIVNGFNYGNASGMAPGAR